MWHDGVALNFHAVIDTALDLQALVFSITVGSWPSAELQASQAPPYLRTVLAARYSAWSPAHYDAAESTAQNHPDWNGADPARPGPHHLFDMGTQAWIDPRTLQDLKDAQWAAIKQSRSAAELGPFSYNAMEFDGDLNAQRRLAGYISVSKSAIAAGQPFFAEFTLADNTQVTLSAQDFVGIELAKVQSVATAFAHAAALRAQIDAALTPETVAAITW